MKKSAKSSQTIRANRRKAITKSRNRRRRARANGT
jgi:hypothetical protein